MIEISCFALIFISTLVSFHIHNLILELVLVVVGENFIKHDMDRVNRESNTTLVLDCILRLERWSMPAMGTEYFCKYQNTSQTDLRVLEQIHCTNSFLIGFC